MIADVLAEVRWISEYKHYIRDYSEFMKCFSTKDPGFNLFFTLRRIAPMLEA
jgi:hypothetical protein